MALHKLKTEAAYIQQHLEKPLVLVGMMGTGKTRVGRKLANVLDLDFYDTDKMIEEKAGYSVQEIFIQDGEKKFRQAETNTMLELLNRGRCVIASGGGTLTNDGIPQAVREKALSIWLRAEIADIMKRIGTTKDRPLLKDGSQQEILNDLMEKRAPLYAGCDITVDTGGGAAEDALERVIKALYGFMKRDI